MVYRGTNRLRVERRTATCDRGGRHPPDRGGWPRVPGGGQVLEFVPKWSRIQVTPPEAGPVSTALACLGNWRVDPRRSTVITGVVWAKSRLTPSLSWTGRV